MSAHAMTKVSPSRRFPPAWLSRDFWAVSAAVIFVVLVVADVLPRATW